MMGLSPVRAGSPVVIGVSASNLLVTQFAGRRPSSRTTPDVNNADDFGALIDGMASL